MLRAESGQSTRSNVSVDSEDKWKKLLRRTQELLYHRYNWPHLKVVKSKTISAGARFYDAPSGLNLDRIEDVVTTWGNSLPPITRGIGFDEYNAYDSEEDERADPVLRWDVRWTGSATQIEVWPVPASDGAKVWFMGYRPLSSLIKDDDTADLDDQLIVLFAAAELLGRQKSQDAELKLSLAQAYLADLRANSQGSSEITTYGQGVDPNRTKRRGTVVRVTS